jgi:HlyD family secretion protein
MAQEESVRSRVWWWVAAAVIAAALLLYLRMNHRMVAVRTAEVDRESISSSVSTNGKVVPSQDFQAHAALSGEVKDLYASLGEKVRAGQELVRMDDSEARRGVATAQANLASAKSTLNAMQMGGTQDERIAEKGDLDAALAQQKQAASSLASLEKLQAQGAASANEIAAARQRLGDANAKVNQLQTRRAGRYSADEMAAQRAQVAQAQAALDAALAGLAGVDVRAPFAGTVYAIPVSQYDFVSAGEALLDVADLTKLQVLAYFDEPEVGKLAVGQPVTIVWDAKPGMVWHGHIFEAPTTIINYGTRNVGECLITVDDANGDLLPNTNVTVKVTTSRREDVLSVPREALHTLGTSNYVFKIADGKLVKTVVGVGALNLTRVEITSGLKIGDKVALGAKTDEELTDGLRVKVEN